MTKTLHQRLVERQSKAELERKWKKSLGRWSNRDWGQEEMDLADREAEEMAKYFADMLKKEE